MKWATRAGCHIDRVASAWLIQRFIDAEAEWVLLDGQERCPEDAIPFDIPGARLSHHDGNCTYETILGAYALAEPALVTVGRIVHQADLEDDRYDAPEAAGIEAVIRGLALTHPDREVIAQGAVVFDGLYALKRR